MNGAEVASLISAINGRDDRNDGFFGDGIWGIIMLLIVAGIFTGGLGGFGVFGRNGAIANDSLIGEEFIKRDIFNTNQNVSTTGCQTQRDVIENRYTTQLCCCDTQKEVLENRYQNALQTQTLSSQMAQCCCDLKTAIHAEGEATRLQMQNDKIDELRASLNNVTNSYNNLALANSIVSQLEPKSPIPAYITCSPYESSFYGRYGFNGYGYGCNNGCGCNNLI